MTDDDLLERDEPSRRVTVLAERAAGGTGSLVVIEAAPGLGKSSFLHRVRTIATEAGLTVLTGRGIELEHQVALGLARQLFERTLADLDPEDRATVLDGAAAPAADLFAPSPPGGVDPYPLIHALSWLTAHLAERAPLVVLVDDAQWVDPASVRFLHYLGARLDDLPVLLVVAHRPPGSDDRDTVTETPPLATIAGAEVVDLERLSPSAVTTLVQRRIVDASPALVDEVVRLTNGNPLLVDQVLVAAVDGGVPDRGAIGPGAVLAATLTHRLVGLGSAARDVLDATTLLGGEADLGLVAAVAGRSITEARDAVDQLVDLALLVPMASREATVQVVHAAVRDALAETLRPDRAEALHRRAVGALRAIGAPADLVAPHLAALPPAGEAEAARVLHEAGRQALGGAEARRAVRLLRRALAEPPATELTGAVLADLTRAAAVDRDPAWRDHLTQLRAHQPPDALATTLRRLGQTLLGAGDLGAAAALLQEALDLDALGPDDRLGTVAALGLAARGDPEVRRLLDEAVQGVLDRPADAVTPAGRSLLAMGAYEASRRVEPGRAVVAELARRAVAVPDRADGEITRGPGYLVACLCLTLCDDWEATRTALDRAQAAATRRGHVVTFAAAATYRARAAFHQGRIDEAIDEARAGVEAGRELWGLDLPGTVATLSMALRERGSLDEADRALVLPAGRDWTESPGHDLWLVAHCDLAVARGDAAAGLVPAERIAERRAGPDDNPATVRWRSTLARALAATDDPEGRERARHLVEDEVGLCRRFGAPRPLAAALRALADLSPDLDERLVHLAEARALLDGTGTGLEQVRVGTALGRALRQARRPTEAREPLRAALAVAEAGGATVLARTARTELEATGARPRRAALVGPAALTPSEARVARLAAQGSTNREIAEQLFVGVKTVEYHLANAYPKLGVRGRGELADVLPDDA